jgi:ferredoxin
MTVFYFTATGNSLAVAKSIAQSADGKLISIPQVIDAEQPNFKDDVIGIVFPIYSWSLPLMVRRFLDGAKLEADYLFAVGTYGSISGGAMAALQKRFHYTNKLLMLDNFLPLFETGKQIKGLPSKKVEENTAQIVEDIKNRKHFHVKSNPVAKIFTRIADMFSPAKSAKKYIINNDCNLCGICAKVCPARNITVTDGVHFSEKCEGCMACLHLCPQNALHLKNEKSGKRWRHPDVSLNEIIEANLRNAQT